MPDKHAVGSCDVTAPLSAEIRRNQKNQEPTAEVPEAMRTPTEPRPPRQVARIDRAMPKPALTADPVEGYCPPWAGVAYAPKGVRFPVPTKIVHRGRELQPRVDLPPRGDQQFYNDPGSYPWRCVCRITNAYGKVGSGVLVGPQHILTASHCVAWSTTESEKIEVHRAGNVSQAVAFDTVAIAFTQIEGDSAPSDVLDEDYAVLVTNERLGDRFGWLGSREYNASWDGGRYWDTMGYVLNSTFPLFQLGQWLDEDELDLGSGRAMTTSADLLSGQSGSPMFGQWSGNLYVVAVMSSDDPPESENWCAGGSDLPRLVRFALDNHP